MSMSTISEADRFYNAGVRFYAKRQFRQARSCWVKAVKADGKHYRSLNYLGLLAFEDGELDWAADLYEKALEIKPDYAVVHNNLGNVYKTIGAAEKAVEHYRRAAEIKPRDTNYRYNLARTLFEVGDYEGSKTEYRKVIIFCPEDAEAQLELGETYYHVGEYEKALEHFEIYLGLCPDGRNQLQMKARIRQLKKMVSNDAVS